MSERLKGTCLKLSPARKMMIEMPRHARRIPSIPVAKVINVKAAGEARASANPAPSWTAVFIRAYGLVCQRRPELRRSYMPWPYPHLYEHPHSVCGVAIERQWQNETVLFGAKIRAPEEMPIGLIHENIRRFKETPVWEVGYFRQALRIGRLPGFLRRFTFWQTLYLSGQIRAKRFGTFMVSSYGSLGAEQLHPLSPHTSLFTFGPISAAGDVTVKIVYDHRVLDGRCIAQSLNDLEHILQTEIVQELRAPADSQRAA